MAGRRRAVPLFITDELAERLGDPSIAIVEVDEDTAAYTSGHIPGAVSLDWKLELHAAPRRDFIDGDTLAALLGSKGIGSDQTIVLYGGNSNWFAAYAYWLLAYRGISNVKLLDGGRKKWELEDRPLTNAEPTLEPRTFERGRERPELRIFRDEILRSVGDGVAFVDVRSPGEFTGEVMAPPHLPQEQPYVPGHIPGARNVPWSTTVNPDGSFLPPDELRELYRGADVAPNGPVVSYCRIGERSSHTWFVLSEILGYPDVRNYDGSWTEYGSLVDAPVSTGSEA
jgi:thiosulfate/3-mercaptopyruvate sulfurtransferase